MQYRDKFVTILKCGIILGIAWLIFLYWPASTRWTIPRQNIHVLGYCQEQQEIIAVQHRSKQYGYSDQMYQTCSVSEPQDACIIAISMVDGSVRVILDLNSLIQENANLYLSPSGRMLGVIQKSARVIDLRNLSTVDLGPVNNESSLAFSCDDQLIAVADSKTTRVWNLRSQQIIHQFTNQLQVKNDVAGNGLPVTRLPTGFTAIDGLAPALQFDQSSKKLAVFNLARVAVFNLETDKLIGVADCKGLARFVQDDMLGVVNLNVVPSQPLRTVYHIEDNELSKERQDENIYISGYSQLDLSKTCSLIAGEDLSLRNFPKPMVHYLQKYSRLLDPKWEISLYELHSGKLLNKIRVPRSENNAATYCGFINLVHAPLFACRLSPSNDWMVMQESDNISLWPMLTFWRPLSCWVVIACVVGLGLLRLKNSSVSKNNCLKNQISSRVGCQN